MFFMSIDLAWSKRISAILFFLMVGVDLLPAQIVQSGRLELAMESGETEKLKAASLGNNGLILYRRLAGKKDDQLELIKIDTALKETWKGYITLGKNVGLLRVQHTDELFFLLFRDRSFIGGDFQIVGVNHRNGAYVLYTIKNLIPFNPSEFLITKQGALIGGYFNYRPIILYYNFKQQRSKVLPGFFNEPGELDQLKSYPDGSVDIIVSAKNYEKRRSLWIRNYDSLGDLIKTTILKPEERKNLIFGRSVKLPNGEQIVAGVYGRFSDYSRGIFVAGINPVGEYAIVYYNFAQLQNFFSYMKARRQKRIKDRIERKTIRGKKVKFNYRFIIHDIIPYQNQFIMTGEAFYPHYIYPTQMFSGYRYNPTSVAMPGSYFNPRLRNDVIFDGYQYTHAVVIGFDNNGKVRWDNSFEINDVKTMQLEQFVKIKPEKDRIILMYLFQNTLRAKIIHDAEVLEGKTQDPMKTNFNNETEDIQGLENEQLDYWYDGYFFAYGVQRLKQESGRARRVFFINKITYK